MGHKISSAHRFESDHRRIILALAEVVTPAGRILGEPGDPAIDALETILGDLGPAVARGYQMLLDALELAGVPVEGRELSRLPRDRRRAALERLSAGELTHLLVRAVVAPIQMARAHDPVLERALGMARPPRARVSEAHRWGSRSIDARSLAADEEIEVDCVVVGTGAGGAPIAARLAARGHAVVMLEEGGHFGRADFAGDPLAMQRALYRDHGLTVALGRQMIALPLGRTVGGTTTINSGTCFRTPDEVLHRWQLEHGLFDLGPRSLDPYFEKVEDVLGVAPTPASVLGGVAQVIARGCDALGWAHGPLHRNAPGCDAQGVCCFGCPTDAKRSTNVSYVPMALEHGAMLYHHAEVERVLREGDRAVGVEAFSRGGEGARRRLVVRAKTVVLACGALHTPALLFASGIAAASGQLGKNLTIHPAGYAWARFAQPIRGWEEVPQGYGVEELVDQGIRFEGAFVPLPIAAGTFDAIGEAWTDRVERFDRMASFGFMLRDTGTGRVTLGGRGGPRIRYTMSDRDVRTFVRAQAALARIYLAASAEIVHPGMRGVGPIRDLAGVESLEREVVERARPHHLDVSAYHPLGTCRMGADPRRSVLSSEHEIHDVESLFVCDGSAVNGPLGVNPQITIMALSERATQFVERRIEGCARASVRRGARRELAFEETMAGTLTEAGGERALQASFTVRAHGETGWRTTLDQRGATMALEGTITVPGLATERACRGSLVVRPLRARANLVYDLSFESDDGERCTLHGEKHAPGMSPTGMTRLHTEVRKDGERVLTGLLEFDLRDLPEWLASFRLRESA